MLPDLDGVLVMTVNPGFAGQKLVPQTLKKITRVRKMLDDANRQDAVIEVDGNVSVENAIKCAELVQTSLWAARPACFIRMHPLQRTSAASVKP